MKSPAGAGRFAERIVEGRDDGGSPERVVIWIERRAGINTQSSGPLASAMTPPSYTLYVEP